MKDNSLPGEKLLQAADEYQRWAKENNVPPGSLLAEFLKMRAEDAEACKRRDIMLYGRSLCPDDNADTKN